MKSYLDIVQKVVDEGVMKENRTGVDALTIVGPKFEHDMSEGFPLLTTKKMAHKAIRVELEGFLNGITDKKWYQDRGCHIWDDWCNPKKVPYANNEETKKRMKEERDLGAIYGWQWRHFRAEYENYDTNYNGKGFDQLEKLVETLEIDPNDRGMLVNAWNPPDLDKMALRPCHYNFDIVILGDKLNLVWDQRSVDTMLGLPFNIASYAILLHLLAKQFGFKEGELVGHLKDVHIYENHFEGVRKQLNRKPYKLPRIETKNFKSIFDWKHTDSKVVDYQHHPKINYKVNV